jgi:hypothetical protein
MELLEAMPAGAWLECAYAHQYDVAPSPRVIREDFLGFTFS